MSQHIYEKFVVGDFLTVGIRDIADVDITHWVDTAGPIGIIRVRRHLFISSDIRIKAFTFNQN